MFLQKNVIILKMFLQKIAQNRRFGLGKCTAICAQEITITLLFNKKAISDENLAESSKVSWIRTNDLRASLIFSLPILSTHVESVLWRRFAQVSH
jgi:hypothetical protein